MKRIKYLFTLLTQVIRYRPDKLFIKIAGINFIPVGTNIKSLPIGNFELKNNKWGLFKLTKSKSENKYIQYLRDYSKDVQVRVSWITPIFNRGVLGYPSIVKSDLDSIEVLKTNASFHSYFSFNIDRRKKYNLSYDLWFSKNNKYLDFHKVSFEVMIWEEWNIAHPSGEFYKRVTLNDNKYDIYHGKIDKSKEGYEGWILITFKRVNPSNVNGLKIYDLKVSEVVKFIKEMGYDLKNEYLNSFQFGSEVFNAVGDLKFIEASLTGNKIK